jgi:hypothetical protein
MQNLQGTLVQHWPPHNSGERKLQAIMKTAPAATHVNNWFKTDQANLPKYMQNEHHKTSNLPAEKKELKIKNGHRGTK